MKHILHKVPYIGLKNYCKSTILFFFLFLTSTLVDGQELNKSEKGIRHTHKANIEGNHHVGLSCAICGNHLGYLDLIKDDTTELRYNLHADQLIGESGNYLCINCNTPLFKDQDLYESRLDWIYFYRPIEQSKLKIHITNAKYLQRNACTFCGEHIDTEMYNAPSID